MLGVEGDGGVAEGGEVGCTVVGAATDAADSVVAAGFGVLATAGAVGSVVFDSVVVGAVAVGAGAVCEEGTSLACCDVTCCSSSLKIQPNSPMFASTTDINT